ncbi:MAG: N-acetylneuraminate synthase, partial [Bacteroidales bacterium]|nr:N-acetylneuraminate synthase [Bacteroidales bacterium]
PEEWGLNVLDELRNRYNVPVGLSDHSGEIYASLAAAALGADIIEFHVAFDKRMFGPDSPASLTISQTTKVVQGIRTIRQSLLNPVNKNDISKFAELKTIFEKSLSINRNMKAGTIITIDMLEAKKPKGYGIPASEYESVLGRKLKEDMNAWDFLNYEDLQ